MNEGAGKPFTPSDFNCDNAPVELVQYIIDNTDDFGRRYSSALNVIGRDRCPLRMADNALYDDMYDCLCDWCSDNGDNEDNYDLEEIFG